jgi:hypothetical protein
MNITTWIKPGKFSDTHSYAKKHYVSLLSVDPRATMRRAGLSHWKTPVTPSGIFLFFLCTLPVLSCPDCPGFAFCPYCTTQITQASMSPAGFKPAIPEVERPKTYVLDRMTTGTCGIEPAIFRLAVQCSASANFAKATPPPPYL